MTGLKPADLPSDTPDAGPCSNPWENLMRLTVRVLAAAVTATLTLGAPAAQVAAASTDAAHGAHSAHAKPGKDKPAKGAKGSKGGSATTVAQRQLLREIAKVSGALDRVVRPSRIGRLTPETQVALLANVELDRSVLEAVTAAAATADGSVDLGQARQDLKAVRTVNYVLVVNVLRKAERLLADGRGDAAALTAVVDAARLVTAATAKDELRDLRAALQVAATESDDPVAVTP